MTKHLAALAVFLALEVAMLAEPAAADREAEVPAASCETARFEPVFIEPEMTGFSAAFYEPVSSGYRIAEPAIEESETEMPSVPSFDQNELELLAKTVWGEARGLDDYEKSMVIWCILNRLDDGRYGETIEAVVTAPYQFAGYDPDFPLESDILELCEDVLTRWKSGGEGRTLPSHFVNFTGDGRHNYFTDREGNLFDFSTENPYGGE